MRTDMGFAQIRPYQFAHPSKFYPEELNTERRFNSRALSYGALATPLVYLTTHAVGQ